jgi:hypothetical protein
MAAPAHSKSGRTTASAHVSGAQVRTSWYVQDWQQHPNDGAASLLANTAGVMIEHAVLVRGRVACMLRAITYADIMHVGLTGWTYWLGHKYFGA